MLSFKYPNVTPAFHAPSRQSIMNKPRTEEYTSRGVYLPKVKGPAGETTSTLNNLPSVGPGHGRRAFQEQEHSLNLNSLMNEANIDASLTNVDQYIDLENAAMYEEKRGYEKLISDNVGVQMAEPTAMTYLATAIPQNTAPQTRRLNPFGYDETLANIQNSGKCEQLSQECED